MTLFQIKQKSLKWACEERAATAVEYGFIAAVVAVGVSAAFLLFQHEMTTLFQIFNNVMEKA